MERTSNWSCLLTAVLRTSWLATLAMCTVLVVGLATLSDAETWDLAADWSETSNPNGPWTYGSYESDFSTYAVFTLFDTFKPEYIPTWTGDFSSPQSGWVYGASPNWWEGLCKCNGTSLRDFPGGRIGGHTLTGVIWTAPRSTTVNLAGGFWTITNLGRSEVITLLVKGVALIPANVAIPGQGAGVNSGNTYKLDQAIVAAGGSVGDLRNIQVNEGDEILLAFNEAPGSERTWVGIDFTITEEAIATGGVTGTVTDAVSGAPVQNATVQLIGVGTTTTGADGKYTFTDVISATYTMSVVKSPDYVSKRLAVSIPTGDPITQNVALDPFNNAKQGWDLAADWGEAGNPNGPWAYGSLGSDFVTFTLFETFKPEYIPTWTGDFTTPQSGWVNAANPNWWEGLCKSNGTSLRDFPGGRIGGHALTGVRWTAPRSMTVYLTGGFWTITNLGRSETITLVVDGVSLIPGDVAIPGQDAGVNSGNTYKLDQAIVAAGGTVGDLRNIHLDAGDEIYLSFREAPGSERTWVGTDFTIIEEGAPTTGGVTGAVTDAVSGAPIQNATAELVGVGTITTGADGKYTFTDVPWGAYTLVVKAPDHASKSLAVSIPIGGSITRDVALDPLKQVWDLADDWSDAGNPNGDWSYGYYDGTWTSLSLHTDNLWGSYGPAWTYPGPGHPNMLKSDGRGPLASYDIPAGAVGGHGPSAAVGQTGYVVARWTAPADISVDITGNTWVSVKDRPHGVTLFIDNTPLIDSVPVPTAASSAAPYALASAISAAGGDPADLQAIQVQTGQTIMLGLKTLVEDGSWYGMNFRLTRVEPNPKAMSVRFSPPGGVYDSSQYVTMSSFTPGVTIHYTTDGTEPTEGGPTYQGPVAINQTLTLKAKAYKQGLNPSVVKTAFYGIGAGASISSLKNTPDGTLVLAGEAAVTATFGDTFYIEALDRSSGIRVDLPNNAAGVGRRVKVVGLVTTDSSNGERYIQSGGAADVGPGAVAPLAMNNRALGGGPDGLQQGIAGAAGRNNIGLLVTAYGKTSSPGASDFYLDDGSGVPVHVLLPENVPVPDSGLFVTVTGISSCEKVGGEISRAIRAAGSVHIPPGDVGLAVSTFGGGHQVWIRAANFVARSADGGSPNFVADPPGSANSLSGSAHYFYSPTVSGPDNQLPWWVEYEIPQDKVPFPLTGSWKFWARSSQAGNSSADSDWLIVRGDPNDTAYPDLGTPTNDNNRILNEVGSTGGLFGHKFGWYSSMPSSDLATKAFTAIDGKVSFRLYEREAGPDNALVDVICWSDNPAYTPTDADLLSLSGW